MAVAASHRSGYVREVAVSGLAASGDGRAIPYVLLCLNDWVKEIRRAARSAIEVFFQPVFAPDVIAALPIVWALARQNRDDHERFVSRVLAFLRSPACAPALRAGCGAPEREVRRVCFELLLRRGGGTEHETPEALSAALADRDPVVRVWAARRLPPVRPAGSLWRLLLAHGRPGQAAIVQPDVTAELTGWLPADLRFQADGVLTSGQRLAQEAITSELLAANPGWDERLE